MSFFSCTPYCSSLAGLFFNIFFFQLILLYIFSTHNTHNHIYIYFFFAHRSFSVCYLNKCYVSMMKQNCTVYLLTDCAAIQSFSFLLVNLPVQSPFNAFFYLKTKSQKKNFPLFSRIS